MCMLLGADLMPLVGVELTQTLPTHKQTTDASQGKFNIRSVIPDNHLNSKGKRLAQTRYPELFTRTGGANNHIVRTKFKTPFTAKQPKGSRVPVAL